MPVSPITTAIICPRQAPHVASIPHPPLEPFYWFRAVLFVKARASTKYLLHFWIYLIIQYVKNRDMTIKHNMPAATGSARRPGACGAPLFTLQKCIICLKRAKNKQKKWKFGIFKRKMLPEDEE